jgi:pimeloyl-ACP methyl ester carboxylesterase
VTPGDAARTAAAPAVAAATTLHHVRDGSGPPLVLLSGIGMDGSAWRPVLDRLTPERDVWAVDLPGFGGSAAIEDGPCGIDALADSAEAFIAASRLERPHVAGNSLGGVVALELARRGVVASATALSPAGFGTWLEGRFAVLSLRATYAVAARLRRAPGLLRRPRLRRLLYAQIFAHAERLTPGEAYGHMCVMLDGTGFAPVLEAMDGYRFRGPLRSPATIAWGTRDALLLPTEAFHARRGLPEARHLWLRGCGHVPMSDDPAQVARVLLEGSGG